MYRVDAHLGLVLQRLAQKRKRGLRLPESKTRRSSRVYPGPLIAKMSRRSSGSKGAAKLRVECNDAESDKGRKKLRRKKQEKHPNEEEEAEIKTFVSSMSMNRGLYVFPPSTRQPDQKAPPCLWRVIPDGGCPVAMLTPPRRMPVSIVGPSMRSAVVVYNEKQRQFRKKEERKTCSEFEEGVEVVYADEAGQRDPGQGNRRLCSAQRVKGKSGRQVVAASPC